MSTVPPSSRTLAFAVGILLLLLPSLTLAQRMPNEVVTLYEDLRISIETEDVESIASRFAPILLMQSSVGEGWLQDLAVAFQKYDDIAAEMRFDDYAPAGDRALALVTWSLAGVDAESEEEWSSAVQRVDILVKVNDVWELMGSDEIDQDALASCVTGNEFSDRKTGLSFTAPNGWRLLPFTGATKSAAAAYSPDFTTWIVWAVADLPVRMTGEQMAAATKDIITNLGPKLGVTGKDFIEGASTLAGRESHELTMTLTTDRGDELRIARNFLVVDSTLYAGAVTSAPPAAIEKHRAAIDKAMASTRIVAPEVTELPPEAGRLEGGVYINDVQGCKVTPPEGWETKISEGQWKVQMAMIHPGGESSIMLGMIDLPIEDMTAQQAVEGDENISAQALNEYERIRSGDCTVGDIAGYESICKFTLGEQTRQRRRVYLVDEGRLFFFIADAIPATDWEKLEPIFTEIVDSFEIFEPPPPPPDAE